MPSVEEPLDRAIDMAALADARAIVSGEQDAGGETHVLNLLGRVLANYDRLSVRVALLAAERGEVENKPERVGGLMCAPCYRGKHQTCRTKVYDDALERVVDCACIKRGHQ